MMKKKKKTMVTMTVRGIIKDDNLLVFSLNS
jgi:hypothetical protein